MQPLTDREKNDLQHYRRLAFAAGILAFLLIITGGMARVTQTGGACMDWPTCLGSWNPPAQSGALIDYTHRAATILVAPFLAGALFIAWRRLYRLPWLFSLTLFSAGLFVAQIGLGAAIALSEISTRWIPALHLFLSLGLHQRDHIFTCRQLSPGKKIDATAGKARRLISLALCAISVAGILALFPADGQWDAGLGLSITGILPLLAAVRC